MKLAMTLMVRDEADIIASMIEHHLNQGVDIIIATDNGSADGTTEILERYAAHGVVDLRHDPVHRKQQGVVVTQMARDAATIHGADWVINADADEFWMPVNPALTLREAFGGIDRGIQSFTVDVIDMTGPPAMAGTGLQRLIYRDQRSIAELNAVGLHAHSTHDAAHIGDPEITVIQGNHFVSLASLGAPAPEFALEVLHFPWRSWAQFSHKVENAGKAYLSSPDLKPSPNHHGMRDFKRLQNDTLFPSYYYRHPSDDELRDGTESGSFVIDRRVADALIGSVPDVAVDAAQHERALAYGKVIIDLESRVKDLEAQAVTQAERVGNLSTQLVHSRELEAAVSTELARFRNRKVVRVIDKISHAMVRGKSSE
ncbi:glycosyltransferase family 2 protein [Glaciibacter psychrotolerans]|uniref:Glycosyltransferase involved in cell wall biosynthesis/uncharacterized coiled-coil protein SlyX n=1 Tax=Glaciibacter psychrotolerans TaxID=670054 RepID=A0A7Z0EFE4_9MICO|nr:glycosyltransferase family 2 protein [Leifsonia psychrotolerans]NYJ20245.1 glycosyltransferase involved in cell wall biosynthesis/uncharacterized coiled-coil protein SlyX [Leifsonia psychrotolerans]